jgi:nicotinamidase-related amidase
MSKPKCAVLVIDMLRDFVGKDAKDSVKSPRADAIIPNVYKLLSRAYETGIPIFYCSDAHFLSDHELKIWGEHAMAGTRGAEVIPELRLPEEGRNKYWFDMPKHTYSGFVGTPLDMILRDLGIDTLVISGLHTHICDRHTTADAWALGYKIVVPKDCVETFTEDAQKSGLEYLTQVYSAKITTVEELVKEFKESDK